MQTKKQKGWSEQEFIDFGVSPNIPNALAIQLLLMKKYGAPIGGQDRGRGEGWAIWVLLRAHH